jgi:predicted nucleic acid-binding protein
MATTPDGLHEHSLFIDSSAFFAEVSAKDPNHREAARLRQLATRRRLLAFTSNFVVAEAHALIFARLGRRTAVAFLGEMDAQGSSVIRASEEDEAEARQIIYRYTDKTFSLTDAISFAIMRRLGIQMAFAFDRDFAQFGFEVLHT